MGGEESLIKKGTLFVEIVINVLSDPTEFNQRAKQASLLIPGDGIFIFYKNGLRR